MSKKLHGIGSFVLMLCMVFVMCQSAAGYDLETVAKKSFKLLYDKTTSDGLVADHYPYDATYEVYQSSVGFNSIASTGFYLAGLAIACEQGWTDIISSTTTAETKAYNLLSFLNDDVTSEPTSGWGKKNGFFSHFLTDDGERFVNEDGKDGSEVSAIDTALLVAGALAAGEYFGGNVATEADELYDAIDWTWMLNVQGGDNGIFHMGWKPASAWASEGFIGLYDNTSEAILLYLLAVGAPTASNRIDAKYFYSFIRDLSEVKGTDGANDKPMVNTYYGSLFAYQYPQAYFDLRGKRDREGIDWFYNTIMATLANRKFCRDHADDETANRDDDYTTYKTDVWGLTSTSMKAVEGKWDPFPFDPEGESIPYKMSYEGRYGGLPNVKMLRHRNTQYVDRFSDDEDRYFVDAGLGGVYCNEFGAATKIEMADDGYLQSVDVDNDYWSLEYSVGQWPVPLDETFPRVGPYGYTYLKLPEISLGEHAYLKFKANKEGVAGDPDSRIKVELSSETPSGTCWVEGGSPNIVDSTTFWLTNSTQTFTWDMSTCTNLNTAQDGGMTNWNKMNCLVFVTERGWYETMWLIGAKDGTELELDTVAPFDNTFTVGTDGNNAFPKELSLNKDENNVDNMYITFSSSTITSDIERRENRLEMGFCATRWASEDEWLRVKLHNKVGSGSYSQIGSTETLGAQVSYIIPAYTLSTTDSNTFWLEVIDSTGVYQGDDNWAVFDYLRFSGRNGTQPEIGKIYIDDIRFETAYSTYPIVGAFHDGTITPSGAAGSTCFTVHESSAAIDYMYDNYSANLWDSTYGFKDAYNLDFSTSSGGWFSDTYLSLDHGIILVAIHNAIASSPNRVWDWFMGNDDINNAIDWAELVDYENYNFRPDLVIDDFSVSRSTNCIGGSTGYVTDYAVSASSSVSSGYLTLDYDVDTSTGYVVYQSSFVPTKLDIRDRKWLKVKAKSDNVVPIQIRIIDDTGIAASYYLSVLGLSTRDNLISDSWRNFYLPLNQFREEDNENNYHDINQRQVQRIEVVCYGGEHPDNNVYIDDIEFLTQIHGANDYQRECEDFTSQTGGTEDAKSNASGESTLGNGWGRDDNDYAIYENIPLTESDNVILKLRYSDDVGGESVEIYLDDVLKGSFVSETTGGWNTFTWGPEIHLGSVSAGTHIVKFISQANDDDYGVNIDVFELYDTPEWNGLTQECEWYETQSGGAVSDRSAASNLATLGSWGETVSETALYNNISIPVDTDHVYLQLRYSDDVGGNNLSFYLDNVEVSSCTTSSTGGWNNFWLSSPVSDLGSTTAGDNHKIKVEATNGGTYGVDLDLLEIWWEKKDNYIERECEYWSDKQSGSKDDKTNASNQACLGNTWGDTNGDYAEYEGVTVVASGDLKCKLQYSDDVAGNTITVSVDGNNKDSFITSNTGGWNTFSWSEELDLGSISAGTHAIKFTNGGGSWGTNIDMFKIYDANDSTAPNAVTNVLATADGSNAVDITWTAPSDNVGVKYYRITDSDKWIGTTTETSYRVENLIPNSSYTYGVTACDAAGNWGTKNTDNVTTSADTTAPEGGVVIGEGDPDAVNSTSVTLYCWAKDGESEIADGGEMKFSNDGSSWSAAEDYAPTKSYTLAAGEGTKTVYVKYKDKAGNWMANGSTDTVKLDTTAPTVSSFAIDGGKAYANGPVVTLNYTATDEGGGSGMGYAKVKFSADDSNWTQDFHFGATTYTVTTDSKPWKLTNTEGSKTVYAKFADAAGNWTATSSSDTITLDQTDPTAPSSLIASIISDSQVDLSWTAGTDNNTVEGYKIYSNFVEIGESTTTAYSVTSLPSNVPFDYYVCTVDGAGNISPGTDTLSASAAYSDFDGDSTGWTASTGTWAVESGEYSQSDTGESNTNAYRSVTQSGKFIYYWTADFQTGTKAGMHFFCSQSSGTGRGDSYLVWQNATDLIIYESNSDTLTQRASTSAVCSAGNSYDYKVMYDPATGLIEAWRDTMTGSAIVSWTDSDSQFTSGSYISLKTDSSHVHFDNVTAHRSISLYDDFANGDSDKWAEVSGQWSVSSNAYLQNDHESDNTIASALVYQSSEITYEWKVTYSTGTNAGMFIMCDSPYDTNRGNAYLIWQDSTNVRVYKSVNDSLTLEQSWSAANTQGSNHTYRASYDPGTGVIAVDRDDSPLGSWTDNNNKIVTGTGISLKTEDTAALFDDIKVIKYWDGN